MIYIVCTNCNTAMRVEAADELELQSLVGDLSDFYPDKYPCTRTGCKSMGRLFGPTDISQRAMAQLTIIDVTPQEAFAALNGLGFPKERSCYLEDVRAMLQVGVKRVVGRDIPGTTRCIIDHFELNDGTVVHLGASSEGATVYRVTRPPAYVKGVENSDE